MKINYKKILIVIILLISLIILYKLPKLLINKKVENLPEVKLNNIERNKSLAIMVQETSENNKYIEYEDSEWPSDDYKYSKAECIDNNGNLIDSVISYEDGKITLTTNKTIYCTIYFDKTLIGKLRENDPNKVLSSKIVGDMYRYQGLDQQYKDDEVNNPEKLPIVDNNYICFGTIEKNTCIEEHEKYMYRIIGVTPSNELKLIKETNLKTNGNIVIAIQWNKINEVSSPYTGTDSTKCDAENCEWPNSMIYKRLNGISNGNNKTSVGDSNIFINSEDYDYLSSSNGGSKWYKLIADHSWMYGDTNEYTYNGDTAYKIETGFSTTKRKWPKIGESCSVSVPCSIEEYEWSAEKSITAKIGLMYMHDFYYAYPNGKPQTPDNAKKSWILLKNNSNSSFNYEWFLTRYGILTTGTGAITSSLAGYTSAVNLHDSGNVTARPVFYLIPTLKITSGNGKFNNPYIININE